MNALTADTCYFPNAAKLLPLGFEPAGFDAFGRRAYRTQHYVIFVDAAEGASGEVVISRSLFGKDDIMSRGRVFAGLLLSELFFDQLLVCVGITTS